MPRSERVDGLKELFAQLKVPVDLHKSEVQQALELVQSIWYQPGDAVDDLGYHGKIRYAWAIAYQFWGLEEMRLLTAHWCYRFLRRHAQLVASCVAPDLRSSVLGDIDLVPTLVAEPVEMGPQGLSHCSAILGGANALVWNVKRGSGEYGAEYLLHACDTFDRDMVLGRIFAYGESHGSYGGPDALDFYQMLQWCGPQPPSQVSFDGIRTLGEIYGSGRRRT